MEAYTGFAEIYDTLMDDIPYEDWAAYLCGVLKEYGIGEGLVLELGCGTGSLTELLAKAGYDMIGADSSEQMLQAAVEKREESGLDILYLLQDMREFELYGSVRAVVSVCDCVNYLAGYEELAGVLKLVHHYLDPDGILVFDLNTEYKYRELLGDKTIAESREDCAFIWENSYDGETRMNEYDLTLFIREEGECYRRYEETHYQRAFTLDEVREAVRESGLELEAVCDAFTGHPVREDSERVCVIARKKGQERSESGCQTI